MQYLVTAVGLAVCRHGHIYVMVNLSSGEKHIYAIYVLQYLLLIAALRVMFWWYDINCRWERAPAQLALHIWLKPSIMQARHPSSYVI